MRKIRPIYYIGLLIVVMAGCFFMAAYFATPNNGGAAGKPMTKSQGEAVQATIDKQHQRAKVDTVGSKALTQKAERADIGIQASRTQAAIIHRKSVTHAKAIPSTPTAIDSLQSYFATYGDRPNPTGNNPR